MTRNLGPIHGTKEMTSLAHGGATFAEVINKRNDDCSQIVEASPATATRLAQGAFPGNTAGGALVPMLALVGSPLAIGLWVVAIVGFVIPIIFGRALKARIHMAKEQAGSTSD